jgi:hypothetical protein
MSNIEPDERVFISESNFQNPVVIVYGKDAGGIGRNRSLAPAIGCTAVCQSYGNPEEPEDIVDTLVYNLCLETPRETTHGILIAELFGLVNELNKTIQRLEQRIDDQNDQIRYLGRANE